VGGAVLHGIGSRIAQRLTADDEAVRDSEPRARPQGAPCWLAAAARPAACQGGRLIKTGMVQGSQRVRAGGRRLCGARFS